MSNLIPFRTATDEDRQRLAASAFRMAKFRCIVKQEGPGTAEAISSVINKESELMSSRLKLVRKSDLPKVAVLISDLLVEQEVSTAISGIGIRYELKSIIEILAELGFVLDEQQIKNKIEAMLK